MSSVSYAGKKLLGVGSQMGQQVPAPCQRSRQPVVTVALMCTARNACKGMSRARWKPW